MKELTTIQSKIYEIRGKQVMLDFDLAALYQVETKVLKQAVRRNIERFPEDFMFEISNEEYNSLKISLRSQIVTLEIDGRGKYPKYPPFAFTEMGVAMLSSVLRSGSAIQVNIAIMRAFVAMRNYLTQASLHSAELAEMRSRLQLIEHEVRENLKAMNDMSEDIGKDIDAIYEAIGALSVKLPQIRQEPQKSDSRNSSMKPIQILFTGLLLASLLPGCEIHDDIDVDVKRKAIVYLRYNYNDGEHDTMDEVQTLRLFFFDLKTGRQYRDTTLTREEFLTDTGAMQTYISNGEYGIVTLANVGHGSTVSADNIRDAAITFPDTGADPLFFNRIQTPIQKGDSLRFDIDLFKSVYKVNVRVEGMQNINNPEDFYFGLNNYAALSFDNKPCGGFRMYRPQLARDPAAGTMSGSFYTPYFPSDSPISIGIYTDDPTSIYGHELFVATIQRYIEIAPNPGHDVEIDIRILLNGANVTVIISDWEGTVIQEEHFGA